MGVPWGAGWHYGDAIVLIVGRCAIVVAPSPRTPTRYRIDLRGGACALSAGEAGIEMNDVLLTRNPDGLTRLLCCQEVLPVEKVYWATRNAGRRRGRW